MMSIELLLQLATVLYLSQVGLFLFGLRRHKNSARNKSTPFVTIVIAARNEEATLARCLSSVLDQSYPSDLYEVIVVNDNSTDDTQSICQDFASRYHNVSTFICAGDSPLRGKTNALSQAIDKARGEIILITDADCSVPHTWIECTTTRYEPRIGIAGGISLQEAQNAFQGMQSLDWAYLLGIAASAVALRNPLSTIGNNLSFRREAYEDVGGYRKIKFSVTEDFMLFQSIIRTRKWEYIYTIDPNVLVMSRPCATVRDLVRQKHRWGKGGLDMKPSGFLILIVGFTMHLLIVLTFMLGSFFLTATALFLKLVADYTFLYQLLRRLQRIDLLKYFYAFQLYYSIYVLLLPFLVLFGGKVIWKGRSY